MIRGRARSVPAVQIVGRTIVANGRWFRIARFPDEHWVAESPVEDPSVYVTQLKQSGLQADCFTFAQCFTDPVPQHSFPYLMDNLAVAATANFSEWWQALPYRTRANVRRAEREAVVIKSAPFNEELVLGIKTIYDETPFRQGRRFWHYGKDVETVASDNASYLDRSLFLGAYHQEDLIGFLKLVFVGESARIMQVLSKQCHFDKRPTNALLARAVKVCSHRGIPHLIYGQFTYGNRTDSPVTEFKRRNGFQPMEFPRYYIPLSWKGRLAITIGLHRGLKRLVPEPFISPLLQLRLAYYKRRFAPEP